MSFPVWDPATVVSSTRCSVGWVTSFQVQCSLFQAAMRDAMGNFESLASYLHVEQTTSGDLASMYHQSVAAITASSHHNKTHTTSHFLAGADLIQTAGIGKSGLMASSQFVKISNIAASATRNTFIVSSYTGDGAGGGQLINIGHRPDWVYIWPRGVNAPAFDRMYGAKYLIRHKVSTAAHVMEIASLLIATNANGFTAKGSCNTLGSVYNYWTQKEW